MTERRSEEIERDIARERTALEQSIEALQAQFSADALVDQATTFLKTQGAGIGAKLIETARENPAAVALTGAGIAWLLAGSGARQPDQRRESVAAYDHRQRETVSGLPDQQASSETFEERMARAEKDMKSEGASDPAIAGGDARLLKEEDRMSNEFQGSRSAVDARNPSMRDRAYRTASDLRARIDEGTSGLSDAARERVRRAREAAISAQEAVERHTSATAREIRKTSHDNPLLVGALVAAAGAVLAASLPRTSTEDRVLGSRRDQLFDEANRVFREEAGKLKEVAKAAVDEGKATARDALSEGAKPDAGDAVSRVADAAKAEARRQGVGRVG